MVEGGRNLEGEIMESFFEEVDRDGSIPEPILEQLKQLDDQDNLTDSSSVISVVQEGVDYAHREGGD